MTADLLSVIVVDHSSEWVTASIGAGGAILGAVVALAGTIWVERARESRREREAHVTRLAEFTWAMQAWATFFIGYPSKSQSRNPLDVIAFNIDSRMMQGRFLNELFRLQELMWRTAINALTDASEEEFEAISAVLRIVGDFQIGDPIPDGWGAAVARMTDLTRDAKRRQLGRRGARLVGVPRARQPGDGFGDTSVDTGPEAAAAAGSD